MFSPYRAESKERFLSKLRMIENFVRVAQRGSLSKVARDIELTPSALSKQMSQLERELNAPLMVRGRNQDVTLTPAGKYYLDGVAPLLERLREVEQQVVGYEEPRGVLRVRAPKVLAQYLLMAGLCDFAARSPNLTIRHVSEDDNALEDVSIFIAATQWRVSDGRRDLADTHVLHHLGAQVWVALAAAESPLRTVRDPRGLRKLCALDVGQPLERWAFTNGSRTLEVDTAPQVISSDPDVLISFIQNPWAAAILPLWAARHALKSSAFTRILTEWAVAPASGAGDVFIKVPASKRDLPEVRAFVTHMKRQVGDADVLKS